MRGVLVLAVLLPAGSAFSTPTCLPGTLASYAALGSEGCEYDGFLFSGFRYSAEASHMLPPVAGQIGVQPSRMPVTVLEGGLRDVFGSGLDFHVNQQAGPILDLPGGLADLVAPSLHLAIEYSVRSGTPVSTAALHADVFSDLIASATAVLGVNDAPCAYAGSLDFPPAGGTCAFTPASELNVLQTVSLRAGLPGGAGVSTVSNRYEPVPEPATMVLAGAGLLGTLWLRRRRSRTDKLT